MKKLLVIALALFTLNGVAQEKRNHSKDRSEKIDRKKDFSPKEVADLKSKQLTLALDLSDAQQQKVHQLILAQATEHHKQRAERLANKTEDSKPSKEEMVKMKNERLDMQIAMKREMKSILNADQYAKFEKMKPRKKGRKERKGKRRK